MSGAASDNQDPTTFRGDKTICVPFADEEHCERCLRDTTVFRNHLGLTAQRHPELFPAGMEHGFTCKCTYYSKLGQCLPTEPFLARQIWAGTKSHGDAFGIRLNRPIARWNQGPK